MVMDCVPLPFMFIFSWELTPFSVAKTPSKEPPANTPEELLLKFIPTVPFLAVVM